MVVGTMKPKSSERQRGQAALLWPLRLQATLPKLPFAKTYVQVPAETTFQKNSKS